MNLGIAGRLAVVVGASRGIGMEIARELWSEGCRVISVARSVSAQELERIMISTFMKMNEQQEHLNII